MFDNAKVGDLVYLPNQEKGYEIVYRKENYLQAEINGELYGFNDDGVNPFNKTLGQIIYPHPVTIQDARCCDNCNLSEQKKKNDDSCIQDYPDWFLKRCCYCKFNKVYSGEFLFEQNKRIEINWQPKEES